MSVPASPSNPAPVSEPSAPESAKQRAASGWVGQFARTLKTSRLYDANNPTVVRFREDLAATLAALTDAHGPIRLTFTSNDVLIDNFSLYPARSRDDNLGLPFYRDGIRALTFVPGIEAPEVEMLLDAMLQVTGPASGDQDLVTLLWDAGCPHLQLDYVSTDGDLESGGGADEHVIEESSVTPWPGQGATSVAVPKSPPPPGGSAAPAAHAPAAPPAQSRSDDWPTQEQMGRLLEAYQELEVRSTNEMRRFQLELETEDRRATVSSGIALMRDCLDSPTNHEDAIVLSRFITRLLREAMALGLWTDASEALALQRRCASDEWSLSAFMDEVAQPVSVVTPTAVARLDQQEAQALESFLAMAVELGPPAIDWLMQVLAESQQQRNRRALAKTLAELCRENPERLAPWLDDERWYVVRNVVHILGWIGGDAVAALLETVTRHPEPRVRQEVVAALAQISPAVARPLLLRMLDGAAPRLFSSILHQLSAERDGAVARRLLGFVQDATFEHRPPEERFAILSTLSATGSDDILPEIEVALQREAWFSKSHELLRQGIARCIARIGTPAARAVLEQGAKSRRAGLRKACEDALAGSRAHE